MIKYYQNENITVLGSKVSGYILATNSNMNKITTPLVPLLVVCYKDGNDLQYRKLTVER